MKKYTTMMFALVLSFVLAACSQQRANENREGNAGTAATEAGNTATNATGTTDKQEAATDRMENQAERQLEQIAANPQQYAGQSVQINGAQINEVVADRAFSVGTQGNEVLIVGKVPAFAKDWKPGRNEYVAVSGTVQRFNLATMKKQIGDMQWEDRVFGNWDGKPVIIANSIRAFKAEDDGALRPKSTNSGSGERQ